MFALERAGNRVLTAFDGCEGFLLAQRERPDLIVSQISLPDVSGSELCRLIKTDENLCAASFVLMGDEWQDADAHEILNSGTDDYLLFSQNAEYLATKIEWLIKQKRSEDNLRQYYKILRRRQLHITEIIRETSGLMRSFNRELEFAAAEDFSDCESQTLFGKKIELGINMVDSLARLLEEQVNVLEICERTHKGEEFSHAPDMGCEKHEYDYYEIIS